MAALRFLAASRPESESFFKPTTPLVIMMSYNFTQQLFPLGKIIVSFDAEFLGLTLIPYIRRHQSGDWGDVSADEGACNHNAVEMGEDILSKYHLIDDSGTSHCIVIMTESDRSYSIIHLLDDLLEEEEIFS